MTQIFSIADFLNSNIQEAIEMYDLKLDYYNPNIQFYVYKSDLGITIKIWMNGKSSVDVEINYLSNRKTFDIPLDLLNDFIITDIQIP